MTDAALLMIGGRVIERILIVLGGILCLWLGYRLFFLSASKLGDVKTVEAEGHGIKFKAEGVAPGIFFAGFGIIMLGYAAYTRIDISVEDIRNVTAAAQGESAATVVDKQTVAIRGMQDGYVGLPRGFKAANSLVALQKVQLETKASSLSPSGYTTFMQATPFLTEVQRAFIDNKYGAGTFDIVLGMSKKCDTSDPACKTYRSDPAKKRQMEDVLGDLATGIQ